LIAACSNGKWPERQEPVHDLQRRIDALTQVIEQLKTRHAVAECVKRSG
jgi:hypothetical protein